MASELSTSLPIVGGSYGWTMRARGKNWGFEQGRWTLCFSCIDLSLYPALFLMYLSYFLPLLRRPSTDAFFFKFAVSAIFIFSSNSSKYRCANDITPNDRNAGFRFINIACILR
jgi:hypothetical protein